MLVVILLGSPNFIEAIRDKFLSGQKTDNNLPALRVLTQRISKEDIFDWDWGLSGIPYLQKAQGEYRK